MPIISYGLDARSLFAGVKKVNSGLGSITRRAASAGKSIVGIGTSLKGLATIGIAGYGAKQLADVGDAYVNMAGQLEYLAGSSDAAEQAQEQLYQMSQNTRTSMLENSKAITRFALASEQTGLNMEQNIQVLGGINSLMLRTGVSSQEAASSMVQLGQALASGRLQGDEFRAMSENVPALMNELAKSLGVGRAELKEMASQGALTSDILGKAFLDISQGAAANADELPLTIGGMWTKVVNATQRMWDKINDETGILAWVATGIDNLASWVENNTPRVIGFFVSLRDKAVEVWPTVKSFIGNIGELFYNVASTIIGNWPQIKSVLVSLGSLAVSVGSGIATLLEWIGKLIEGLKGLMAYSPLMGAIRSAGTLAGGGSVIDATKAFFDADNSMLEDTLPEGAVTTSSSNTVNINVNQQVSRSDITNISSELLRQEARL